MRVCGVKPYPGTKTEQEPTGALLFVGIGRGTPSIPHTTSRLSNPTPPLSKKEKREKQVPPPTRGEGTRYAFRNMTDAQRRETQNSETDTSYCGGLVGGLRSHLQPGNKFSSYEHPGTTPAGIQEPPCRVVYFTPIAAQATYSVTPATSVSFTPVVAKQASTLFCFVFPLLTCPGPNRRHVIVFVGYRKKSKIHQRAPCGGRTHDLLTNALPTELKALTI